MKRAASPLGGRDLMIALLVPALACCAPAGPGGNAGAAPAARPAAATASERRAQHQRTRLGLPFHGTWIVSQGYHGGQSHFGYAAYALDLVKVDAVGRAYARKGRRARDWYGFGADVLASADGVVVHAVDRFPDNPVMGRATRANSIIVEHGPAEFTEYVHLQRGSLRVRVGDRVRRGQKLARAGNSGAETPHLHWAFLSSMKPIRTRPAVFACYARRDEHGQWRLVGSNTPRTGEVIREQGCGRLGGMGEVASAGGVCW